MKWDDIYGSVKRFAAHTAIKLNQTADMASLKVKLSMAEKNLDEAYGLLGRISYQHFSNDDDLSERVLAAVDAVGQAKAEVSAVQAQINEARRRAESQNAAYEADKDARAAKDAAGERAEMERVTEEAVRATEEAKKAAQQVYAEKGGVENENVGNESAAQAAAGQRIVLTVNTLSDADDAVEVEVLSEE